MIAAAPDPLILTLAFAPGDQARFDALRQRHFPAERNHIPAHLTLFHHLPGAEAEAVHHSVQLAAAAQAAFPIDVSGLRSLGRGVAFTIDSPPLTALRRGLAGLWHDSLTAQDRQGWRPHITVQNKAMAAEAAALLSAMQASFTPFSVGAEGLHLWHYRAGPWELAATYGFNHPAAAPRP